MTQEEKNLRQNLAIQAMKVFLSNQGKHRRMSIFSRILYGLGLSGWTINYDYGFKDIAEKSFEMADEMMKIESKTLPDS